MIDSSKWEVLETGLRVVQGKSVVNSISLKEGKQEFLHRARLIRRYGAAAVVMLFDEQGQADTYARKIEVAQRAYKLLTDDGFPAEDIIFDPNILAVATGIEAHDAYARDFIEAVRWIKQNLPHAKISGGVSNLSFAFRGNNAVREAMHSVFLYHAIQAGMDMAIVNPQMLQIYSDIEPELLERVEDVILCRRADAAERLTEYASQFTKTAATQTQHTDAWRSEPLGKRIEYAMLKGVADYIEQDALEGYRTLGSPLAVIDRLLMPAMEVVGNLFGQGKMFLPQVVKTARVMKKSRRRTDSLHRARFRSERQECRQGAGGYRERRRTRHRQEHRGGSHGLQRLHDPRPGRDGRVSPHHRRSRRLGRRRDLPERTDYPFARGDDPRLRRAGTPGVANSRTDRRCDHFGRTHRRKNSSDLLGPGDPCRQRQPQQQNPRRTARSRPGRVSGSRARGATDPARPVPPPRGDPHDPTLRSGAQAARAETRVRNRCSGPYGTAGVSGHKYRRCGAADRLELLLPGVGAQGPRTGDLRKPRTRRRSPQALRRRAKDAGPHPRRKNSSPSRA